MNLAIKVENLSKAYQLGEIGTGTLSRDLERWVARIRGREDPFLTLGETNDRAIKGASDIIWSLKDLNFEIQQGDAIGIIGRNGAGKSTLLKLLSRVTAPTKGRIRVKGRIASLLEVGTGFHPELTGRENIFLNGAILGMRRKEIKRKFDEIVDFAGVERYIDTPVKRYSSGMYVRLAFAVASYLECEILIVDEVLAVGDAEFQRRCLKKMDQVSKGEGRTVLFVSHNMSSIQHLCSSCILMHNGEIKFIGETKQTINRYLLEGESIIQINTKLNKSVRISNINWKDVNGEKRNSFFFGEFINLNVEVVNDLTVYKEINITLSIYNDRQELVCNFSTFYNGRTFHLPSKETKTIGLLLKENPLLEGAYFLNIAILEGTLHNQKELFKLEKIQAFTIESGNPFGNGIIPKFGNILLKSEWQNI